MRLHSALACYSPRSWQSRPSQTSKPACGCSIVRWRNGVAIGNGPKIRSSEWHKAARTPRSDHPRAATDIYRNHLRRAVMDYPNDVAYRAEPRVQRSFDEEYQLHPLDDALSYFRKYARERPEVVALTC